MWVQDLRKYSLSLRLWFGRPFGVRERFGVAKCILGSLRRRLGATKCALTALKQPFGYAKCGEVQVVLLWCVVFGEYQWPICSS